MIEKPASTRPHPQSTFEKRAWSASEERYDAARVEECERLWRSYHHARAQHWRELGEERALFHEAEAAKYEMKGA
jgi:hypothetical protein